MYPRQHPSEENMHSPHLTLSHHHRHYGVWHGIFGLSATVRCTMGACESSFLCVSSGLLWRRGARSLPASRATRGHFPKISEQGSESFLLCRRVSWRNGGTACVFINGKVCTCIYCAMAMSSSARILSRRAFDSNLTQMMIGPLLGGGNRCPPYYSCKAILYRPRGCRVTCQSINQHEMTSCVCVLGRALFGARRRLISKVQTHVVIKGDAALRRRTFPIYAPEFSRAFTLFATVVWSMFLSRFWGVGPVSAAFLVMFSNQCCHLR